LRLRQREEEAEGARVVDPEEEGTEEEEARVILNFLLDCLPLIKIEARGGSGGGCSSRGSYGGSKGGGGQNE
jgi:hypothetical protein